MNRNLLSAGGFVLAVLLFLALNVAAMNWLRGGRLDLTEQRLYTLSEGTRRIIEQVPEPITLRFYYSAKLANELPQIKTYGERVRELVEEYVNASGGTIRLVTIDPEPFTDAEDDAVRAGMQAVPVGEAGNLYFGLVGTNMVDDQESIPFFSQEKEAFLEYDLSRMVYNLSNPKKLTVGVVTTHEMNAFVTPLMQFSGGGPKPWALVPVIRSTFDIKNVLPTQDYLPDGIDVLLIVHPAGLPDGLLYDIDQFVMRGGRVLLFVDPLSEVAQAFGARTGQTKTASEFDRLMASWGVEMVKDKVVGDWQAAQQVNAGAPGSPRIVRYLPWLELGTQNYDRDDVTTAALGRIIMVTAGSLKAREGATTRLEPLIRSSEQSMLVDADPLRFGPNPERLIQGFVASGERYTLAARITGEVKSAFPDGLPAAVTPPGQTVPPDLQQARDARAKREHLAASKGAVNLIVVGDTDMLYDQFWQQSQDLFGKPIVIPTASNADLAMNALDNLAGSSDLVGLRSRGQSTRPFTVVEDLKRDAERRFLEEERRLNESLEATQKRLNELQGRAAAGGGALLDKAQQDEIANAREEILRTRKQLRDVQHNLNKDIEALETRIKFANVGLVPILVALLALLLAGLRYQRRRRQAAERR